MKQRTDHTGRQLAGSSRLGSGSEPHFGRIPYKDPAETNAPGAADAGSEGKPVAEGSRPATGENWPW